MCPNSFLKLLKSQIVDIFFFMNYFVLHKLSGYFQQSLLVNKVPANKTVFWVLPVAAEIPDQVDLPLCLFYLLFTVR
ncbi:hypothetical protein D3C81_2260420 [compost metagenome]